MIDELLAHDDRTLMENCESYVYVLGATKNVRGIFHYNLVILFCRSHQSAAFTI